MSRCRRSTRPDTSSSTPTFSREIRLEWLNLEYVDWMSSGQTRFAPLASAYGEMECNAFFNHTPPKTEYDGGWVKANAARTPAHS